MAGVTPVTATTAPSSEVVAFTIHFGDAAVRTYRSLLILGSLAALAACDAKSKEQIQTLAHSDSLRADSLVSMKNELLNEVMSSTQFVSDINATLARARALQDQKEKQLVTQSGGEVELNKAKEERKVVLARIQMLVAKLDSSENRIASLRERASKLSKQDAALNRQFAAAEKSVSDMKAQLETQRAEFQSIIDKQNGQITELTASNTQLTTKTTALTDTVSTLTTEKNTAYYVIGTKDELVKKGVLVEEGGKRFWILGGRTIQPARTFDVNSFTRIDRLKDSVIALPAGEYTILSRQDAQFAAPFSVKGKKIAGGLKIAQPERFWEASKFLILMRS
jgi:hypothetical protein